MKIYCQYCGTLLEQDFKCQNCGMESDAQYINLKGIPQKLVLEVPLFNKENEEVIISATKYGLGNCEIIQDTNDIQMIFTFNVKGMEIIKND